MNQQQASQEKGQALVLLVLGFVVLLGFTALAVDGGMVYSNRRHAQNASDASSLAGGGVAALYLENHYVDYENWNCTNTNDPIYNKIVNAEQVGRDAAVSRAGSNDYSVDENISDQNGVASKCGEEDTGLWIDKYLDITTTITADTDTAFAHFVYRGPLRNTVTATTRVRPRSPLAFGNAVVALRTDCPNSNTGGVHVDGNSTINVNGGGILSNACVVVGGTVDIDVNGGAIGCVGEGCYTTNGSPSVDPPTPVIGSAPLPSSVYRIPPPDCASLRDRGNHAGGGTINPGRYGRIRVNSASDYLVLRSGLYCLSEDFTINGGSLRVEEGGGVTIYMINDDFYVGGSVEVVLVAPPLPEIAVCLNNTCPPAIPGVLIFMAEGNTGTVSLLGSSGSNYTGTVYAPSGTIEAGGGSLETINAQLIGDTVFLHGNTQVVVNYENIINYRPPASLELYK